VADSLEKFISRDYPRAIKITPNINPYAAGSVLVEYGNTKVHITVTVQESVPPFLKGRGTGWLTAEYAMLPSSTHSRIDRDRKSISGRAQEIQRLIGRSLRSVVDLSLLGERTLTVDCDVLIADGGTRTAAITGGYVALYLAVKKLLEEGVVQQSPIKSQVAAISVGINAEGKVIADLNYEEDSRCETDMNIVMTKDNKFIEIQGTAEGEPFSEEMFQAILIVAKRSLVAVFAAQDTIK
jgi:ribonuclease PH